MTFFFGANKIIHSLTERKLLLKDSELSSESELSCDYD